MDIGIRQAGFNILADVEVDVNCCDTLRHAVADEGDGPLVCADDIRKVEPLELLERLSCKPGEIDLLFGGPPCQAFSLIGKQKALDDERGILLFQMVRFAEALKPKVVLMEQVKGLLSARDAAGRRGGVIERLLSEFDRIGYVAKYKVCVAADYGVPQLRERVFLVATRGRNGFQFPNPTHTAPEQADALFPLKPYVTVGEALTGVGVPQPKANGRAVYSDEYRNHVDVTPERDRERIHPVPEGSYLAAQTHLDANLLRGLSPKDTTKYLRLNRSKPSNTLRCGEIFFHPTEDRYLTPREYMRIHGYPDRYLLKGPIRSRTGSVRNLDQHRQVANSVPPPLARVMAAQILDYMESEGL